MLAIRLCQKKTVKGFKGKSGSSQQGKKQVCCEFVKKEKETCGFAVTPKL